MTWDSPQICMKMDNCNTNFTLSKITNDISLFFSPLSSQYRLNFIKNNEKFPLVKFYQYISRRETENPNTYLQNYVKRLDSMGKHPFILIITIYFIHYDCGLPLRTRIFFKSQWFKMPDLVRQSESLWSTAVLYN